MENEYKAVAGEDDRTISGSVEDFYIRLQNEADDNNRVSVIHDYLDQLWQKEADDFFREMDDEEDEEKKKKKEKEKEKEKQYRQLLKGKNKKQLIVREGYRFLSDGKMDPVEYVRILVAILDEDPKSRLYTDDDINELADYLHIEITSRTKEKMIRQIRDALADVNTGSFNDKRIYKCLGTLTRDMLDSMLKYQINDFFKDRKKNALKRKGIDPVYLYMKYRAHHDRGHNTDTGDNDPIAKKVEDAFALCKLIRRYGDDVESDLLIPVILDKTSMCGIFIAGSDFFHEYRTGKAKAQGRVLNRREGYVGVNVINMSMATASPENGITGTLEAACTTIDLAEKQSVDDVIEEYYDWQADAREMVEGEYAQYGIAFNADDGTFSLNAEKKQDPCMEQADRELAAAESRIK